MQYTVTTPTDLLLLLREYQALTIYQICKLLNKEKTIENIRPKLTKLAQEGLITIQRLPRSEPLGSSPYIYSLTREGHKVLAHNHDLPTLAKQSSVALEHTLAINDVAVLAHLLTRQEKRIALAEIRLESQLKKQPIALTKTEFLVPDLFVHLVVQPPYGKPNECIGLLFEIDHQGTEWADIIQDKAKKYVQISYGLYQNYFGLQSLSVIFVVTGSAKTTRVKNICSWIQEALQENKEEADIFLCATVDPNKMNPLRFFCEPLFYQPFSSSLHPIIEKP